MDELAAFIEERNRALTIMDLAWARKHIGRNTVAHMPVSEEGLLVGMHMARYECPSIAPELRHASREWLETNGHTRMKGVPWPPAGMLED